MKTVLDRAKTFRHRACDLGKHAVGQSPEVLFITCADSRVVPALIMDVGPGELFELRSAGNIVPVYSSRPCAATATIEYAVEVLGVAEIVVCGHSHCGAVGALTRGEELGGLPAVESWLRESGTAACPEDGADAAVTSAVQRHVVMQTQRLAAYPAIAPRLRYGRIRLHSWFYEVHTGAVQALRDGSFRPL